MKEGYVMRQVSDSQKKAIKSKNSLSGDNTKHQLKRVNDAHKMNQTGLPDQLKSGIENLSGYSLDDVKVHYNSNEPAQLQAHAFARGTDIHLGRGQEKHLPHEAWHVVQQKQGRVQPTVQMSPHININDDTGLEHEADLMGAKALLNSGPIVQQITQRKIDFGVVQLNGGGTPSPISDETANKWHKGTFSTARKSIKYHKNKHGKGRDVDGYTEDAMKFYDSHKSSGVKTTLKDGTEGVKIQIGKGKNKQGGYWTNDGKLVTYWD